MAKKAAGILIVDIIHFDDELSSVEWFADALVEAICSAHPKSVDWDDSRSDGDISVSASATFQVTATAKVKANYTIVADEKRFKHLYVNDDPGPETSVERIVVLDVMKGEHDGLDAKGIELYEWVAASEKTTLPECIFFLSAYPQKISNALGEDSPPAAQVLKKPISSTRLTDILLDRIGRFAESHFSSH